MGRTPNQRFKPSLNTQGVHPKNLNSKPLATHEIKRPNIQSIRDPFISRQLTWTIFTSNSWSSTSLVTVAEKILGKGKSSMMVSVSYGELLNINEEIWPRTFAQANLTCIENNILKEDLPFVALLTRLARKSISCFLISIPKSDPLFRKENILQILRKKNSKVQDILGNYSLDQIVQIFDQ